MIQIIAKQKCCGCSACQIVCPKRCIKMEPDIEGFLYPCVNMELCIECGLCEQVCPELNESEAKKPLKTYAATNPDEEIRLKSSSGGMFSLLSERIILQDGVVFGACFDRDFTVRHDYTETIDGLAAFRGSKYLQSMVKRQFLKTRQFLEEGRKVLFSGTPCQISGLKRYLRKDYDNLIAIDFICHGVPSPAVWKKYLATHHSNPGKVNFRDKRNGWKQYGVAIVSTDGSEEFTCCQENRYMQMFLSDLNLRPSCYACPAKGGMSMSDITLGDFWGIEKINPDIDDDKGLSLVLIHTDKGDSLISGCGALLFEQDYSDAVKHNPSIEKSVSQPVYRDLFMKICVKEGFDKAYAAVNDKTLVAKAKRRLWLYFQNK